MRRGYTPLDLLLFIGLTIELGVFELVLKGYQIASPGTVGTVLGTIGTILWVGYFGLCIMFSFSASRQTDKIIQILVSLLCTLPFAYLEYVVFARGSW